MGRNSQVLRVQGVESPGVTSFGPSLHRHLLYGALGKAPTNDICLDQLQFVPQERAVGVATF